MIVIINVVQITDLSAGLTESRVIRALLNYRIVLAAEKSILAM
jgi:hypothetical protein